MSRSAACGVAAVSASRRRNELNSGFEFCRGRSAHRADRERCAVCLCVADSKAICCIVRAVMKCLTKREELAVVGTKLQNEELRDIGHCYCDPRG